MIVALGTHWQEAETVPEPTISCLVDSLAALPHLKAEKLASLA